MRNIRLIYSDNGTLYDYSKVSNYYETDVTIPSFVASEDYFYIGQRFPFNHLYIKLTTLNVIATAMTVEYWDGQAWIEVNELFDDTNGLTNNGYISFIPDKDFGWERESTSYQGESVDGLETLNIYDQYWIRISFSNDLTANIELKWIGNLFSNDTDLSSIFPDLVRNEVLDAFTSGKTNWEEQHVLSADFIIQDLKKRNVIIHSGQILNKDIFRIASIYRTAFTIFTSFGRDYTEQRNDAGKLYEDNMKGLNFDVDKNRDGFLSDYEKVIKTGYLGR